MKQMRENNIVDDRIKDGHHETAFARCLEKAFGITGPVSNNAISASFFLFLGFPVFLVIWKIAGINWTRYVSDGCFLVAIVTCILALLAQTASQFVRIAEFARARMNGEEPRKFKEGTPEFAKIVAKCFRASRRPKDTRKVYTKSYSVRSAATRTHTHNHARAYRRAVRPAFAHTSSSPGGEGSDDGSGNSDSGDPPGQQNSVTPSDYSEQSNRQYHPQRSPGSYRLPWHLEFQRRRSA
jgi:hypothetical protein